MPVPRREEAAHVLLELSPPPWLLRHSAGVAEVAAFLAESMVSRGTRLDVALVESAALLHDVDKALLPEDELRALGHGLAGAEWLIRRGHGELAPAVAAHTATLLSDERRYPRWAAGASLEEKVVAYADKRVTQEVVPLRQRFAQWRARHPEHEQWLRIGLARAELLEQEVCSLAGIEPGQLSRLAWVGPVLRAAGKVARP